MKGRVAMISGGGGDIGRAIALEFARQGADLSLMDLKEQEQVQPFLDELAGYGVRVLYRRTDISDPADVREWVSETEEKLGVATAIVSNVGIVTRRSVLEMAPEEWRHEFDVNLHGSFYFAQAAAQRMIHHGLPGSIVFMGSWAAHRPNRSIPAYCVSKAGLRMLCQVLAIELAPHGIVVNEISPGIVNAGLSKANVQATTNLNEKIPLGIWIEPEEIAWQAANLCDPRNRNMTGHVTVIDGGLSMTNTWAKR
jgi:glucose 1-dehydrogenase